MDASCCAALLDVASPALPPGLTARLLRWDELSETERTVARGDLEALAAIMRMTEVRARGNRGVHRGAAG